jgi:hypothetical protein
VISWMSGRRRGVVAGALGCLVAGGWPWAWRALVAGEGLARFPSQILAQGEVKAGSRVSWTVEGVLAQGVILKVVGKSCSCLDAVAMTAGGGRAILAVTGVAPAYGSARAWVVLEAARGSWSEREYLRVSLECKVTEERGIIVAPSTIWRRNGDGPQLFSVDVVVDEALNNGGGDARTQPKLVVEPENLARVEDLVDARWLDDRRWAARVWLSTVGGGEQEDQDIRIVTEARRTSGAVIRIRTAKR